MNNQLIMISDSDPKNLQILKENLEASGLQVITVADGTKAWEEIQKNRPHLVLTEINLPGLNGFQLLEKMQADPNTTSIPLIYLTNQRDVQQRVRSFQMGAKDYLVKPLHVKEVIAHIRMVLRRIGKKLDNHPSQNNKISGSLSELTLADLIESFSVERRSGILTLNNGNNKTGHVYFREGSVINASLGDIRLENAIYKMLPWNKGYFSLEIKDVDVADEISISNLGLLLEGVKRMERLQKLLKKFPSTKTAFTITPTFQKLIEKKKLPEDVKKFISLFDGKKNLVTILNESNYDDFKTIERLLRLYQQGFIKPTILPQIPERKEAKPEIAEKSLPEKTGASKEFESIRKLAKAALQKPERALEAEAEMPVPTPEIERPIQQRIDLHRAEIILPPEKETSDKDNGHDHGEIVEPVAMPEEIKPIPKKPFESPIFNRDEFIKKQTLVGEEEIKPKSSIREISQFDKAPARISARVEKDQILTIGLDEDSLDEIMDILTKNMFQTKVFDVIPELPIHFGKLAVDEFDPIMLLGFHGNKTYLKLIEALSKKILGILFAIDCTQNDIWEYANYVIHTVKSNFDIPFVVTILNYHEQSDMNIEVIRYKLNLGEDVAILAWDANNPIFHKKLLSNMVFSVEETIKPERIYKKIVENVTA